MSNYVKCRRLYDYCQKHHLSFFNMSIIAVVKTLNGIKEFRSAICEKEAREYNHLAFIIYITKNNKDYQVLLENIDRFKSAKSWDEYFNKVKENPEKHFPSLSMDDFLKKSMFAFLTCMPIVDYQSFSDIDWGKNFFPPFIHWGKYCNGRMMFSINANHIFVYGRHLSLFFAQLEKYMMHPETIF
ncbi:MAG: hypothetical protein MJ214_04730 [Bacilli bacterium]|nr:hypothetical protein [Bacilli bacterium]